MTCSDCLVEALTDLSGGECYHLEMVSVLSVPQRHVCLQNPDWVMMSKCDQGVDGGPEDQKPLM